MTQAGPDHGHGTLPVELTHFVGREQELATLRRLVAGTRLLTLTGAGGSGKSRLALELVPVLSELARDGIAWVGLASLMDPQLVNGAVLRALGSSPEGGAASAAALVAMLRDRSTVLILDNCEHLVEACAALADTLLRGCPELRIVATSREALGVAGERAWLVPPLSLPEADASLATLARSDAVRLFVDRARDVLPEFKLSEVSAPVIADICTKLDGIPLAIELAAARVRHMSPEHIRERLGDAFALLTTGRRTALPRHRTLRATLDWSYDLLPEDARVVLRRLAVFRGGFTLELVERVASGDGIAERDVLDLVAQLADRSLVVVREQDGLARYHLLETMRQYAAQRLEEAGEADSVRGRFAEVVSGQVRELEPGFTTTARRAAFAQLEPELDNIREVLEWTQAHDPPQHVQLVGRLWWFWFSTRHWVEAHRWITGALALPAAAGPTHERAALLFAAGALAALRAQDADARALLEEAAPLAAAVGDARLEAYALNYTAMSYASTSSPEAGAYATRAEQWLREHDDAYGLRLALLLGGLADQAAGDGAAAIARMEEAVAIARRFGQDRELAVALQTHATVLIASGHLAAAEPLLREAIEALKRDPAFLFLARAIEYYAYSRAEHSPREAARALGAAHRIRSHIAANRFGHDEARILPFIAKLRAQLGPEYDVAFEEGARIAPADAAADVLRAAPPASDSRPAQEQPEAAVDRVDLQVSTLGTFEVQVQGQSVETWPYAKPKELLALLLLHPPGRTRGEIGAALWPEAAPAQVRNSFHVTMHHLRKTLGHPEWLERDGERYRIAPQVTTRFDVLEFRHRVDAALASEGADTIEALRGAMSLYRGHFLVGETTGAWRDEVQDDLRRRFCDAGLRLGALLDAQGDADGAVSALERVIACEPLHEGAHRALLLILARTGRRAQALRHFDRLAALLHELALEPEEETLQVHTRIRSAAALANEPLP